MNYKEIIAFIRKNNKNRAIIPFLLVLVLGLVPFVFRLHKVEFNENTMFFRAFPSDRPCYEVFHYYKGVAIIFLCFLMGLLFFKHYFVKNNLLTRFFLVFIVLIILSSFFSKFQAFAFSGGAFSYQGVLVWVSYVLLAFFASTVHPKYAKYLIGAAVGAGVLMSFLGLVEFFDVDIRKKVFNFLPVFHSDVNINYAQDTGVINALFYNQNYYGVFLGILSRCAIVLFLFSKNRKQMLIFGSIYAILFFNLLGSASKTGFYTLALSFFFMVLFLRKKWKKLFIKNLILTAITVSMFFIVDSKYKGTTSKLVGVVPNQTKILTGKANIPGGILRRVFVKNNVLTIEAYDHKPLYIKIQKDGNLKFSASKKFKTILQVGQDINNPNINGFEDKEFENITFQQRQNKRNILDFSIKNEKGLSIGFPIVIGQKTFYTLGLGETVSPIIDPPKIDYFNRRNMLFTQRGMLWALGIPLIAKVPFLGYGADTYPLAYPNNDYISRYKTYANLQASQLASSHCLYTQIGVEFGGLFLLLFLIFNAYYLWETAKKLWFAQFESFHDFALLACFLMVFFYLSAGVLNSSMLSVSPLYWVFIGLGFALQGKSVTENDIENLQNLKSSPVKKHKNSHQKTKQSNR